MSKGKRKKRSKEKKGEKNPSTGDTAANHEEQGSDLHAPLDLAESAAGEPRPKKRSKHDKRAEQSTALSSPKESPIDISAGNDNKASDAAEKDNKKRDKKKRRKKKRKTSTDPTSSSSSADIEANSMAVPPESKKRKTVDSLDEHQEAANDDETEDATPSFPYPTDADDHCESPLEAYRDILPLLKQACKNKSTANVRIYDPYYCDGAVKVHMQSLGFPNVYNQKEDCYSVWANPSSYPACDLFVTNPPYSGDHIEKLMKHVTSTQFGSKPWFLLMPQFVHKKDYYLAATKNIRPFYLVPRKRYVYLPPKHFRESKKSDVHKKSSPFVSMWFCYGGTQHQNNNLIQFCHQLKNAPFDLARSKSALRDLRRKKR